MTTTFKEKTKLVVPPSIQRRAGIKPGDQLEFKVFRGMIIISPRAPSKDEPTPAERRAIDRGIARSDREYKQGRGLGPFATHEEFVASLHTEAGKAGAKKNKRTGR
jgi:bifunctional DNA-binding transcriptional regulator/antitoxin component of YhaV-PrlF toxin-antitoxin module